MEDDKVRSVDLPCFSILVFIEPIQMSFAMITGEKNVLDAKECNTRWQSFEMQKAIKALPKKIRALESTKVARGEHKRSDSSKLPLLQRIDTVSSLRSLMAEQSKLSLAKYESYMLKALALVYSTDNKAEQLTLMEPLEALAKMYKAA